VNQGYADKGHCYHYVQELLNALDVRTWRYFDLHWGEAYAEGFRENNSLVVTAKGAPFSDGLAIDEWRKGSRPFWKKVRNDRFPWVEAKDFRRGITR